MAEKDYEFLYNDLLKRYTAAQETLRTLQRRLEEVIKKNEILKAESKQWENQKVLQNEVIQHQLGNSDSKVRELQDEIIELKKEIKQLKSE